MAASIDQEFKIKAIANEVLKQIKVDCRSIAVSNANDRFKRSDYLIKTGSKCSEEYQAVTSVLPALLERLKSENLPVHQVTSQNNVIGIHLHRTCYFQWVITAAVDQGVRYGCLDGSPASGQSPCILVNNSVLQQDKTADNADATEGRGDAAPTEKAGNDCSTEDQDCSLDTLRALLLQEHLLNLLTAQGYTVTNNVSRSSVIKVKYILSKLSCITSEWLSDVSVSMEQMNSSMSHLQSLPYVMKIEEPRDVCTDTSSAYAGDCTEQRPLSDSWEFNIRKNIEDRGSQVGGKHFDKNLNMCCVIRSGKPSAVSQQAIALNKAIQDSGAGRCIHLVGQGASFHQQRVHLLSQALQGEEDQVPQSHFVYGQVLPKQSGGDHKGVTANQYYSIRYKQMKQAAIMKYGDSVNGDGWESTLISLTAACVKFELLSSVARGSVKVCLTEDDDSTLTGSFVMYNCARLSTLLSNFEDAVASGTYPRLPVLSAIDFSTLREEEEWTLLFKYVYQYPGVVRQTVEDISPDDGIGAKLHTHKICQMLNGLGRSVSSYYSRYHVLVEARPHLLPTMYARIYLLKAVYQVFTNGLALLGIQPLSQL